MQKNTRGFSGREEKPSLSIKIAEGAPRYAGGYVLLPIAFRPVCRFSLTGREKQKVKNIHPTSRNCLFGFGWKFLIMKAETKTEKGVRI